MGDLSGLDLNVVYGYSLKNSGVTLAAARGVEKYLRNGHGRAGSSPIVQPSGHGGSIRVQASLETKLAVSNM
jgi:hypothetical protein